MLGGIESELAGMSQTVTLEVSDEVLQTAIAIANYNGRTVSEVLSDLLSRSLSELPLELLPDSQVVAIAQSTMPSAEAEELRHLQAKVRDEVISPAEQSRLDELLQIYRRGLVTKAKALHIAVERGLIASLG